MREEFITVTSAVRGGRCEEVAVIPEGFLRRAAKVKRDGR